MVIFVLSVGIITIMQAVTRTTNYISETAQRTIALNLAKEGIEAVYNIRNTNWRRRSSQRNACWLKADPMVDETSGGEIFGAVKGRGAGCEDDLWLAPGTWVLEDKDSGMGKYFWLSPVVYNSQNPFWLYNDFKTVDRLGENLDFNTWVSDYLIPDQEHTDLSLLDHAHYRIHNMDNNWVSHATYVNNYAPELRTKEEKSQGIYWRIVNILGLFPKQNDLANDSLIRCQRGDQDGC